MKMRDWIAGAFVAAMYVVITGLIAPIAFGAYQFRISEMLNHLAVFHKKYTVGIVAGVFLSNLFFSTMVTYDLIFGVGHSLLSLLLMLWLTKHTENKRMKMVVNTIVFAGMSFLIAWELNMAFSAPFWFTYFTVAVGEIVVMGIGIPLMEYLNKRVQFSKYMH